ncbi:hypothetical protein BN971_00011 [Mycobacterium bohemicum DSM 44277]|jgi:hypothetical protein|uniref:Uncharacterized protein n=1 Tax=Mycobacterium bohemicum DSM 44277 TaxID=1236609 RepID=A0A0U0W1Y3_MYCBE|nr:hypothetical protein [Mycobacterium bohemicum]CPR00694.1 hypothetical protein BN971_00011 [Mycobacterium bohemicum DSM 44277]
MWIIELNIGSYQFTREVPALKDRKFRFSPRHMHWPASRSSQAA